MWKYIKYISNKAGKVTHAEQLSPRDKKEEPHSYLESSAVLGWIKQHIYTYVFRSIH